MEKLNGLDKDVYRLGEGQTLEISCKEDVITITRDKKTYKLFFCKWCDGVIKTFSRDFKNAFDIVRFLEGVAA